MRQTILAILLLLAVQAVVGCQAGGNRRSGAPTFTRTSELRGMVGKRVTLVGTARSSEAGDASIQLRDGRVELPAYQWPSGYADRAVTVMGTLAKPAEAAGPYRLGEIELADTWSR